jgi:16S rRNA (uracil1498-N3)-methyltransferase
MTRLFLPPEQLTSKRVVITGDQARHLARVLRAKPGDSVTILDSHGYKYACRLLTVHKKEVQAEVIRKEPSSVESPVSITLAQGIPKGEKMDLIVQKSTELGVNLIIPLVTERSQVRHTDKLERWRKIAISASEQSGRDKIPEISEPVEFNEFLVSLRGLSRAESREGTTSRPAKQSPLGIIFSEEHQERNLKKILKDHKGSLKITLLIGPEGGFSEDEVQSATENGFIKASLGPRILRTETAPITALGIIQYALGDMG